MANIETLKSALALALAEARALGDGSTEAERHAATQAVTAAQEALSSALAEGAKHCPLCKVPPIGIEQPTAKGREYEVGCRKCGLRVSGGLLPRHAVEAWNERMKDPS